MVGLSYFENKNSSVGRAVLDGIVDEARKLLVLAPTEGQPTDFRCDVTRWNLLRGHEQYISRGMFSTVNHLGAAFLSTRISLPVIASEAKQSFRHEREIASAQSARLAMTRRAIIQSKSNSCRTMASLCEV